VPTDLQLSPSETTFIARRDSHQTPLFRGYRLAIQTPPSGATPVTPLLLILHTFIQVPPL